MVEGRRAVKGEGVMKGEVDKGKVERAVEGEGKGGSVVRGG